MPASSRRHLRLLPAIIVIFGLLVACASRPGPPDALAFAADDFAADDVATDDFAADAVVEQPLRADVIDEAVDLARYYWINNGRGEAASYEGFGVRARQANGSQGDAQLVYVSFHASSGDTATEPALLTWVDLENHVIVDARVAS